MSERNPLFSPEEGDIILLPNGVYVLVDLHEPLRTCFTRSDGQDGAFDYLAGWERMVRGGKIIQRGSPEIWPWHYDGWLKKSFQESYKDHVAHMPSKAEALAYIQRAISEERKVWHHLDNAAA